MSDDILHAPARDCVLRDVLDRFADETPETIFGVFEDRTSWTFGQLRSEVRGAAHALRKLGVAQGDHVLVWLPSGRDALKTWFAINYLGAVYVPINTAYRGRILAHVVANSDAAVAVVHADLVARLADIDKARLERVVVLGGTAEAIDGLELLEASALGAASDLPVPIERPIAPWDTQAILYTSGTTGLSKGVLSSYLHLHAMGEGFPLVDGGDRFLVNLPLFHAGGTGPVYWMLCRGGSIVLVASFRTEQFWPIVRETGVTTLILLGVMAGFLMKRPDDGASAGHRLRSVVALPLDEGAIAFGRRYGLRWMTIFNMTEVSCPLVSGENPDVAASAGRPRAGVEVRIVDENDIAVAPGEIGELIVRTDRPWALNHGYYKDPEATVRAWRNGWFHTGDGFRVDEAGEFFFVDRMKDAIRRRGENISSFEVEAEICAHPAVREAAAVAVPSDVAEDDVLVAVSLVEGALLDPLELIDFLRPRMAHFMIPRYIRVLDDLPKTPTQKVQKHILRSAGVTPESWDREAAGVTIKRDRIGRTMEGGGSDTPARDQDPIATVPERSTR
jgi:crotonobetaine/carnitine-CoA ligase